MAYQWPWPQRQSARVRRCVQICQTTRPAETCFRLQFGTWNKIRVKRNSKWIYLSLNECVIFISKRSHLECWNFKSLCAPSRVCHVFRCQLRSLCLKRKDLRRRQTMPEWHSYNACQIWVSLENSILTGTMWLAGHGVILIGKLGLNTVTLELDPNF